MLINPFKLTRELRKARTYVDFNQQSRHAWVAAVASEVPAGNSILDVGAGPCRYKPLFRHCEYKSHDFAQYEGTSAGLMQDEWQYGAIDYVSDIKAIPVPDASFDAILCTEVLEHVPEPIRALEEMARIIKTGGILYLSAPLGSGRHQTPYHFYGGYTPEFYQQFLPAFGFEILYIQPNGGFFKHYLQESHRAGQILLNNRKMNFLMRGLIKLVLQKLFPVIFYHLDDKIFIEEFTVGYHVKARKHPAAL